MPTNELEILEIILGKCSNIIEKGSHQLSKEEISEVLVKMLFGLTRALPQNILVDVRDFDQIAEKGAFRYSGKIETIFKEGLMPEDVYQGLKALGPTDPKDARHVGPSYLRVKGLLTHWGLRTFFGKQMAFVIQEYLENKPLSKKNGFVIFAPNMTGGVYIGDESGRQLEGLGDSPDYTVWPAAPYARETRKAIEVDKTKAPKLEDNVEGLFPSPKNTSAIFCFEELRTSCETTQNATNNYRQFGYTEENGVRIIEACVFDYRHPVGIGRMERLGVDGLYLIDGKTFFDVSRNLDYITDSQYSTAISWLRNPWVFTRKILPSITKIAERKKQMA